MDESNGAYEGTTAWRPHSDRSDQKRTPDFLGQIPAMINNDHSKSIRSITSDIGIAWVSYQVDRIIRHSVFFIQDVKGSIFIVGHEERNERPHCKAFEQIQTSPLTEHALVFLR